MENGNCMPIRRIGGTLDQQAFRNFHTRLDNGAWCHIYPEGRIWQDWRFQENERKLGDIKLGVGKLVAHCKVTPIVIPIYHKGMDNIIPEVELPRVNSRFQTASIPKSLKPTTGGTIEFYVGQPLNFTERIAQFNNDYPNDLSNWATDSKEKLNLYAEISIVIRNSLLALEAEACGRTANEINSMVLFPRSQRRRRSKGKEDHESLSSSSSSSLTNKTASREVLA